MHCQWALPRGAAVLVVILTGLLLSDTRGYEKALPPLLLAHLQRLPANETSEHLDTTAAPGNLTATPLPTSQSPAPAPPQRKRRRRKGAEAPKPDPNHVMEDTEGSAHFAHVPRNVSMKLAAGAYTPAFRARMRLWDDLLANESAWESVVEKEPLNEGVAQTMASFPFNDSLTDADTVRNATSTVSQVGGSAEFHRLNLICLDTDGSPFLVGNDNKVQQLLIADGGVMEVATLSLPSRSLAADATLVKGKILWLMHSGGKYSHSLHWSREVAVTYLTALHMYVGAERESDIMFQVMTPQTLKKIDYAYNLTSIISPQRTTLGHYTFPVQTCFETGYVGWPLEYPYYHKASPRVAYMFVEEGWRAYYDLRKRYRRWAATKLGVSYAQLIANALPPSPVGGAQRELQVAITFRTGTGGFGRNVTNVGEVVEGVNAALGPVGVRARTLAWEKMPLARQVQTAIGLDVLVGIYGNALAWMLCMQPQGVVIEMWPHHPSLAHLKGVNIHNPGAYFNFVANQLHITHITWRSSKEANSPIAPKEEYQGKIFNHRCKVTSSRLFMCRHLAAPPDVYIKLVNFSRPYVGNYRPDSSHQGLFPWEVKGKLEN